DYSIGSREDNYVSYINYEARYDGLNYNVSFAKPTTLTKFHIKRSYYDDSTYRDIIADDIVNPGSILEYKVPHTNFIGWKYKGSDELINLDEPFTRSVELESELGGFDASLIRHNYKNSYSGTIKDYNTNEITRYYNCIQSGTYDLKFDATGHFSKVSVTIYDNDGTTVLKTLSQNSSGVYFSESTQLELKNGNRYKVLMSFTGDGNTEGYGWNYQFDHQYFFKMSEDAISDSTKVKSGENYNLGTPYIIPENKQFDGWYTKESGGEKLTDSTGNSIKPWDRLINTIVYPQFK
ncbi:MAG: hypothetical protein HUJ61_04995, partial [Bacilli bacterium]|nr:hypothetical protein [Bacilli bacterium]